VLVACLLPISKPTQIVVRQLLLNAAPSALPAPPNVLRITKQRHLIDHLPLPQPGMLRNPKLD
ncbi:MAG: hypothetical protein O3A87_06775, partial [Verrucomicrobia bacterium]|nr:hypothetical protein [Verrucomicrobiota bacterium]